MKISPIVMARNSEFFTIFPVLNQGLLKFVKYQNPISARAIYLDHAIDLLTGEKLNFKVSDWLSKLEVPLAEIEKSPSQKRVIILFYELGFVFENLVQLLLEEAGPCILAIDITYHREELLENLGPLRKMTPRLVSTPDYQEYQRDFCLGQKELEAGNCYQFNLTKEYLYSFEDDGDGQDLSAMDFIGGIWRNQRACGAYANATYIPYLEKLFLSNTPECLFHYDRKSKRLITRPIKGTIKVVHENAQNELKLWKKLISDEKSQAELYMIADLMRNDLSRIDLPRSKVIKKKAKLKVPGLLHQYSEIEVKLRKQVTLKRALEKIYPGGSVTGAPKKSAMGILKKLERRKRGFYTGSTLLFFRKNIGASLNIRSLVVDLKDCKISYQAGGGITLLSQVKEEFQEMSDKRDSVINLFNLI